MSDDSSSNSVVNRSGGVDFHAQTVNIYGDVVGQNKNDANRGAPSHADTRERYLEQIIRYHRDLDFVGIPELKDRQTLHLEDVFIHLQAEIEFELPAFPRGAIPLEIPDTVPLDIEEIEDTIEMRSARTGWRKLTSSEPSGAAIPIFEGSRFSHWTVKHQLPVNAALRDHPKMVILGDPGAGKTTLLKYLTLAFATRQSEHLGLDEDRLPIFIRLYDYVAKRAERQTDYSLVDYLCTQAHENLSLSLNADFFEEALESGQCCVCLDGLDELGGAGLRREVIAAVNALVNKYPRNRYLITSRLVGYEEAPLDKREFVHHTVLPFSDDDIRAFVAKWYAAREMDPTAARERGKHLIDTIMREPRIKTLATNPLMLTVIALVHRIEAELPHERVKLYDKCVTAMVQTWEEVKGLHVEDRQRVYYKQRRRLLEQLAYWMHSQPGERGRAREIREGDLELQIRRFLLENPKLSLDDETAQQEAHDFVHLVKGRTGLLIERGEGVYSFAHLTFQEYLAAADIEHRLAHSIDAIWNEIQPRLHDAHWREVILLLLGSLNKFEQHPTELVRRIFESTDDYEIVVHRHLYLAARALADRVEIEAKLRRAIVDQLLALSNLHEWWVSNDAFTILGSLQGDDYVVQSLLAIAQVSFVDAPTRRHAAQALGQLGHTNEATQLLLAFAQDPKVGVYGRSVAAQVLGQFDQANNAVLEGLLGLVQDSQIDIDVRCSAAHALAQLGQATEAVRLLLALIQDSQMDEWTQSNAAQALGQLGIADEAILRGLLVLAQNFQVDAKVRLFATQALGQLGQADEAARLLLAIAQDPQIYEFVRSDAVEMLGQLELTNEVILKGLLALAQDSQVNAGVRFYAVEALGRLGQADGVVLDGLLALTRDSEIQGSAAHSLGQLGQSDETVLMILRTVAQDSQMDIGARFAASEALGRLGQTDEAVRMLFTFTQSPMSATIQLAIAKALGQLGQTDKAMQLLLALAQDSQLYAEVRCDAVQALGQLDQVDEAALKVLLALAQDSEVEGKIRRSAVETLGQIGEASEIILKGILALAQNSQVRDIAHDALKALLGIEP